MKYKSITKAIFAASIMSVLLILGCKEDENPIASYLGETYLKNILIEQNSFTPKITWIGGYISTLGVNTGKNATIDTSLIWLAHSEGNNLTYPTTYGILKTSQENLSEFFGGSFESQLSEDETYTFWIAKENIWSVLSNNTGKIIKIDSALSGIENELDSDTLFVAQNNFSKLTYSLDVFMNVDESSIQNRGRLGTIFIEQTDTSNNLNITWEFTDTEITDLSISAIGICEGQQFDLNSQLWDMYSLDQIDGENVYGSKNIITQPISLGEKIDGTRVFYEFSEKGLERNKNYYLWIATNEWDGESRGRTANGYATITFTTW